MINLVSSNKDSKDPAKNKLLASFEESLNNLLELNMAAVKFSSQSRYQGDGNIKDYIKLLKKIVAVSGDKLDKLTTTVGRELNKDPLIASIGGGVVYIRGLSKDQIELLSEKAPALNRLPLPRIFVPPLGKTSTSGSSEVSRDMSFLG